MEEKKEIFVVDDDPGLLDLLRYLIKKSFNDCEVTTFTNGQSVADRLATCVPEIIITDVMMPGMGGVELIYKISSDKRYSNIKIIAMTGLEKNDPRIGAVKLAGLFRLVYKEMSFTSSLIKAIEDAMAGRLSNMANISLPEDNTEVYEGFEDIAYEKSKDEGSAQRQAKTFNHESVLESMEGDIDMLRIAVKTFLSTSEVVIKEIETGINEGNIAIAASAAHTMAGAAGIVGGERMKNICVETESLILTKGCKESMSLLRELKSEFEQMIHHMKKFI